PDEHSRMQLRCDPALAVVVIEYRADLHALGLKLGAVLKELLFLDVESYVVHGPDSSLPLPQTWHIHGGGATVTGIRRVGEPEECEGVAAAHVEEEVLTRTGRQVDRLDQLHSEHLCVELHSELHVGADERQVIDAAKLEFGVLPLHGRPPS